MKYSKVFKRKLSTIELLSSWCFIVITNHSYINEDPAKWVFLTQFMEQYIIQVSGITQPQLWSMYGMYIYISVCVAYRAYGLKSKYPVTIFQNPLKEILVPQKLKQFSHQAEVGLRLCRVWSITIPTYRKYSDTCMLITPICCAPKHWHHRNYHSHSVSHALIGLLLENS